MKKYKRLNHDYTVTTNNILKAGLSLRAIGLYLYILSKPDGWDFSISGTSTQLVESRDVIRTAIHELEKSGFLVRSQNKEKGKFASGIWIITDEPDVKVLEKPLLKNPTTVDPMTVGVTQVSTNKVSTKEVSTNNTQRVLDFPVNQGQVEAITSWAYERASYKPSMSEQMFRDRVGEALSRYGFDRVHALYADETNAIRFLTNLKGL
jgi:hypothetical protein